MALPRKLKFFNLSIDGGSYLGEATEITLPKIAMKTEDYRSGGMLGDVAINMGVEKLELEAKFGGAMVELRKLSGEGKINGTALRFSGAYQREDTGVTDAIEIVCRGRIAEIDAGSAKAGDNTEETIKFNLTYYKLSINGTDVEEIDMLGLVHKVYGKDRLKDARKAIGM